ncbi:MAG: hypothetical protein KIG36_03555 [Eubacteriales bacterium]|nr:hypothetical protein [Eubacteriales bacterium]
MKSRIFGILLVLVLLLTACGPAATPTLTPEPTATPTAEPTPEPTPIPTQEITEYVQAKSINDGRSEYDLYRTGNDMLVMPNVFGNNMLIQQRQPVRVWGYAPAGEKLEIRLLKQATGETIAQLGAITASDGTFLVELPGQPASYTAYELRVKCGKQAKVFKEILFGELYIAGGQSNMQVWMGEAVGFADELKAASDYPYLRYYNPPIMPMSGGNYPTECLLSPQMTAAGWGRADNRDFEGLSAIAYGFIKNLFELLNVDGAEVPVGVLSLPIGGTRIAPWIPASQIDTDSSYSRQIADIYLAYSKLKDGTAKRTAANSSALYNAKIAPVTNMNVRGLLWYQGESDEGYGPDLYATAMEKLIVGWGEAFRFEDGSMPTIMAQLAPFETGNYNQAPTAKVAFNQTFVTVADRKPDTRAVVAIYDIPLTYALGDKEPIHPKDKLPIGQRFAYAAYGMLYDTEADWTRCPAVKNAYKIGGKYVLQFSDVGEGLRSSDGLPLRGFAIAGEDKVFYAADAVVTGKDTVELSSPFVTDAVYASYAFTSLNMKANLVNSRGVAALPYTSPGKNLKYYAHHDYANFDFLQTWRYFGPNNAFGYQYAQDADMYRGNGCVVELDTTTAVAGNSLKLTASSASFDLDIILNYSGDIHQFKQYKTISLCATAPIVKLMTNSDRASWEFDLLSSEPVAGTDFTRYTFSLTTGMKNGVHTDSMSLTTKLEKLRVSFSGAAVVNVDSLVLGK